MRLINTSNGAVGAVQEFFGKGKIPKYAILSHTWGDEEVSLLDMNDPATCRNKLGYGKIAKTCSIAAGMGLGHAWVDTCCIDKSSSAELTEAINSMYRWYQRAEFCYAYLSDLPPHGNMDVETLKCCRWFSRGWTLQELIAPKEILFFDQEWNYRGSKSELGQTLSRITLIGEDVLRHKVSLSSLPVAQKMSWAAHRETTRVEDGAYCLLGIFDVYLPLLYGEEERAFRRLQEEIIKYTADLSIFAWERERPPPGWGGQDSYQRVYCGVLASSPLEFSGCASLQRSQYRSRNEFSITNLGIRTRSPIGWALVPGRGRYGNALYLDCCYQSHPKQSLAIRLRKCGPNEFLREDPYAVVRYDSIPPMADPASDSYLLTDMPDVDQSWSTRDDVRDMKDLIAGTRTAVLQLEFPSLVNINDIWPRARYDFEDNVAFICGYQSLSSTAVRLRIKIPVQSGLEKIYQSFFCMCYALDWAPAVSAHRFQYTLIDDFAHTHAISEAAGYIASDRLTASVLVENKIPKASSVSFKIPGTRKSAVLTGNASLTDNRDICRREFWKLELSCRIYKDEELPPISYGQWE